jgi:cell wall-associated NlpC family hydrolase
MIPLDRFIGIPYRNRGDSFEGGDCWGLVWMFHRLALGREIPRYAGYSDAEGPDIPDRITAGWQDWTEVPRDAVRRGDVLAMRVGRHPVHVGVAVDASTMLHVLEGRMSCLESFTTGAWKHALVRVGRWTS